MTETSWEYLEWKYAGSFARDIALWLDWPIEQVRARYHELRAGPDLKVRGPGLKVRESAQSPYYDMSEISELLPPEVVETILSETPAVPEFTDDVRDARWRAQRGLRRELHMRINQALGDDPKRSNLEEIAELVGTDLRTVERARVDYISEIYKIHLEFHTEEVSRSSRLHPLVATAGMFGIAEAAVEAAHEEALWDREQYDWPFRPDWQLEPATSEDEQEEDAPGKAKVSKGKAKIPAALKVDVLRRDKSRCLMCGRKASDGAILHMDHIVPESKGGPTSFDNLQTLCAECNTGKGNRFEDDLRR